MAAARIRYSFELLSRMERIKRLLRISFPFDARGGRAGAARLSRGQDEFVSWPWASRGSS